MKFLVDHRKELTIILYIMAAIFYIAAAYEFCQGNTSQGIIGLVLGSSEMCIASSSVASLKREEKANEEENTQGDEL